MNNFDNSEIFDKLVELVKKLRSPEGCPWDREQTGESLKPYLIEEAHEVLEALDSDDPRDLCEELGDLLFQVLFHSEIASENESFNIYDVCRRIHSKMVLRHPHVFADENFTTSEEMVKNWETLKSREKAESGRKSDPSTSLLDGIPPSLPALHTARLVSAKAAATGFDWPDLEGIQEKLTEEINELNEACQQDKPEKVLEEMGDILFTVVNIARFLKIDPESALRQSNKKFIRRFKAMENDFRTRDLKLRDSSLEEMEEAWNRVKNTR